MLGRIEYISNHGTETGIYPRFMLQFIELGKSGFHNDIEKRFGELFDKVLSEIERLLV